ncbi:hypothetical protein F5144DRAFT_655754 [Chaetomium tenue]|uniref:Uncharacterized protein n=1 Tax=Chaetomium tenue TaxID=1854479 RepID=A0ACB7NXY1_9PEZI|nr:hypothetical protein F5144DRAFT_655754 [Chaetomium globosum]
MHIQWTFLSVFKFLQLAAGTPNLGQQPLADLFSGEWQHQFSHPERDDSSCVISHLSAFDQVEGPVTPSLSVTEHPESPKLAALNATAWDQWEFDGGNLRIELYMTLEDGTRIEVMQYIQHSAIIDCAGYVKGIWNSSGHLPGFRVSKDMRSAKVWWETGRGKGIVTLDSLSPPVLANGLVWPPKEGVRSQCHATVQLGPGFYFSQPISGGKMVARVQMDKKTMSITGHGAHARLWAEDGWVNVCYGWHVVRGYLGPYTISFVYLFSKLDKWLGEISREADHVLFRPDFTGNLSGSLADRLTGRVLEFVSATSGKTWRFHHAHETKMFEMDCLIEGKGGTGFVTSVQGGELGTDERYDGGGFSEQVLLPEIVKNWQIWLIYGYTFARRWKNTVINFLSFNF